MNREIMQQMVNGPTSDVLVDALFTLGQFDPELAGLGSEER